MSLTGLVEFVTIRRMENEAPIDSPLGPRGLRAVIFDYGNTLVQFTAPQIEHCDRALAECLERLFGPVDRDRLRTLGHADRRAPYCGEFREINVETITANLIRKLFDREPEPEHIEHVVRTRLRSFVEVIEIEAQLTNLLLRLKQRYKLGLLSNFPCTQSIHESLEKIALAGLFDAVVVSADVGHVKPHPLPFRTILDRLGVEPGEAVYIGDNWLGDIQGAKRIGLRAVHTRQWDTPEKFDREVGDHEPDLVIDHLGELAEHLLPEVVA